MYRLAPGWKTSCENTNYLWKYKTNPILTSNKKYNVIIQTFSSTGKKNQDESGKFKVTQKIELLCLKQKKAFD